LARRYVTF